MVKSELCVSPYMAFFQQILQYYVSQGWWNRRIQNHRYYKDQQILPRFSTVQGWRP